MASELSAIYTGIEQRILKNVEWATGVTFYNSQNEEFNDNAYNLPHIFISFANIDYESKAGWQSAEILIRIFIMFERYLTDAPLQVIDKIHELATYLHGYKLDGCGSLQRIRDAQDLDYTNVIVMIQDYRILTNIDMSTDPNDTLSTVPNFEIQKDLDIDNIIIRSGDGE